MLEAPCGPACAAPFADQDVTRPGKPTRQHTCWCHLRLRLKGPGPRPCAAWGRLRSEPRPPPGTGRLPVWGVEGTLRSLPEVRLFRAPC